MINMDLVRSTLNVPYRTHMTWIGKIVRTAVPGIGKAKGYRSSRADENRATRKKAGIGQQQGSGHEGTALYLDHHIPCADLYSLALTPNPQASPPSPPHHMAVSLFIAHNHCCSSDMMKGEMELYASKFQSFESALIQSNETFKYFKAENEKIKLAIRDSEKEKQGIHVECYLATMSSYSLFWAHK